VRENSNLLEMLHITEQQALKNKYPIEDAEPEVREQKTTTREA
jgi:hypothetical protein